MGLIIKNYSFSGLVVPAAYAGINKAKSFGNVKEFNIVIDIFASVDAKIKGIQPINTFTMKVDLTTDEVSIIPVFKIIYGKLKDIYPDNKDYKDFDTTKAPIVTNQLLGDKVVTISGTVTEDSELKISGHGIEEVKVKQSGKDWSFDVPTEVYSRYDIFVDAWEAEAIPSDMVRVKKTAEILEAIKPLV